MKNIFFILLFFVCSAIFAQNTNYIIENPLNKTPKDWSFTIDTTWGPGLTTAEELDFFDTWWHQVDQTWGAFPNLIINWDSLKNYYRAIVEAGVSRGRFYGILGRLVRALSEIHVMVVDPGVDSIFGIYYDQNGINFDSSHYEAGIPLLNLSNNIYTNYFGAGITTFMDSIALVYSVMPNHPLNLQPGDIILGYDGLPWKQNLEDLLYQELPLIAGHLSGSSPESVEHLKIISAGLNWGLFNTIDIIKYSTGDTLHYPTSLLSSITQPFFIATEQMPINGVPFPNPDENKMVSWGVVEGTTIGYIYVWDWKTAEVSLLFGQAVNELMHLHNATGLIIDYRKNGGGGVEFADDGFRNLFNFYPASNIARATRIPGDNHFLFDLSPGDFSFQPTMELFDHPIAVLTGPSCVSAGDYNAYRMRFHPMTRFFGKKTSGAYTYPSGGQRNFTLHGYRYQVDDGCMYSNYNNEGLFIHKTFPVDEEVWLTPDGVANGQDDVVNRALEWINNMVYPHDIVSDKKYYPITGDTILLTAIIENPNSHLLSARGYIHNLDDVLIDSVDLTKQSGGENWTGRVNSPVTEDFFKVSVSVFDQTASDQFTVPHATRFSTVPLLIDSLQIAAVSNNRYTFKPFLKNAGSVHTLENLTVKLTCNDPWVTTIYPDLRVCPNLLPGQTKGVIAPFAVTFDSAAFPGYFNLSFSILSNGWDYWKISRNIITGVENETEKIPSEFLLSQNYPNPFNNSSVIKYSVPQLSQVTLEVFNILGEEIETLVNEEKPAGTYELTWNAESLPSGIYFSQLRAGSYVQTRKMILIK